MKRNLECEMVRDLLPNYIEKLTSEKTNKFIKEHLGTCEECGKIYESMNIDLNIKENGDIDNKKKVKIFKKLNKKVRVLQAIIISTIIIYLGIYAKNLIILNSMIDLSESNNFNNYYQKSIHTNKKASYRSEYYQNNDNFLYISVGIHFNNITSKTIYGKFKGEYFCYNEENGIDHTDNYTPYFGPRLQWRFTNKFGNPWIALVPTIVRRGTLAKKDCYILELDGDMFYLDKETGMEIKKVYTGDNTVYDDEFYFGTVTDEQIEELIKPYKDKSLLKYVENPQTSF